MDFNGIFLESVWGDPEVHMSVPDFAGDITTNRRCAGKQRVSAFEEEIGLPLLRAIRSLDHPFALRKTAINSRATLDEQNRNN